MGKVINMQTERDKLIDRLIDEKNELFMRVTKIEKQLDVAKSRRDHFKQRYMAAMEKIKELSDEINNYRAEER